MHQHIEQHHHSDEHGNPAGGETTGIGIRINWQHGPLGRGPDRKEPNGAFVEGVIAAALGRLEYYQSSKFSCQENANAIQALKEAMEWCEKRTSRRENLGVEGTHEV